MAFHLLHLCLQGVVLQPNARFSTKRKHACDPCNDWNVRCRSSYCWWLTSVTIWEVLSIVNSWKTRRPTYHWDRMHWPLMNLWLTKLFWSCSPSILTTLADFPTDRGQVWKVKVAILGAILGVTVTWARKQSHVILQHNVTLSNTTESMKMPWGSLGVEMTKLLHTFVNSPKSQVTFNFVRYRYLTFPNKYSEVCCNQQS